MSGVIVSDTVRDRINVSLERIFQHGVLEHDKYETLFRQYNQSEGMGRVEFDIRVLRDACIRDFRAFLCARNVPWWRNPIYDKIFRELAQNEEYRKSKDYRYKPIVFIALPRGAMKTTIFIGEESAHFFIKETMLYGQTPVVFLGHGDIDKVTDNLGVVRKILVEDELIQMLYGKILQPTIDNSTELKFVDYSPIKRKDSHFSTGSVGSDPTGKHITKAKVDDWVTRKNTNSETKNIDNKKSFWDLFSLDDHTGGADGLVPVDVIGTPQKIECLYHDFENKPDIKQFVKVIKYAVTNNGPFDPDHTKESDLLFPEILGLRKLTFYKSTMPASQFSSQYDMDYYDDEERFVFEGELPDFTMPDDDDVVLRVVVADPAMSKKNKKSQAVVMVIFITRDGHLHVIDSYATWGMKTSEQCDKIFSFANAYRCDKVIVEAIHYQESLAQRVEERRAEMRPGDVIFGVTRHRHFESKKEHYTNFLEPLLTQQRVHVNPQIKELIKQIYGRSNLDDHIDALSFIKEIKINSYIRKDGKVESSRDVEDSYNRYAVAHNKEKKYAFEEIGW